MQSSHQLDFMKALQMQKEDELCNISQTGTGLKMRDQFGITFMGDFQLVLNFGLFEMGPQDNIQEMHLSPMSSAHLKESPDWKFTTLGRKMQG